VPTHHENDATAPWFLVHPLSTGDQAVMASMRAVVEPNKGRLQGVEARVPFNAIIESVAAPAAIDYEADQLNGVPGLWRRPTDAAPGHSVIHIHGGWFHWGSAQAFRHLAGHIASHAAAAVFVPDYRLAPEHPFPAAIEDIQACYFGLRERGHTKIAVAGDSAGGNLALGLLVYLAANRDSSDKVLVGGVANFTCDRSVPFGRELVDPCRS
jgi:epsilon-lactone hydrolase